jgi:hypothetical protein
MAAKRTSSSSEINGTKFGLPSINNLLRSGKITPSPQVRRNEDCVSTQSNRLKKLEQQEIQKDRLAKKIEESLYKKSEAGSMASTKMSVN